MDSATDKLIGQTLTLTGHFDSPVRVEAVRPLAAGFELRVRTPDGHLEETAVSADEFSQLQNQVRPISEGDTAADPDLVRLLVESAHVTVEARKEDGFDPVWLRNAVTEPIEESGAEVEG